MCTIIFDLETSGLNPYHDDITNRDLRTDGKPWGNAYSEFYNWFFENTKDKETITLVSHNGDTFDFVFFRRMLKDLSEIDGQLNINLEKINFIDTLPLSKRLYPNRTYYNQPSLARTFSIIIDNAHRAMGDVIVLEQLYSRIIGDFKINTQIDGLEDPLKVREFIDLKI